MGVTSLWQVLSPCARPVKIETLNKKRLAVDASIWVYHFLKAVRDKEGNALRNSHIVGFYRRICKLLFFGIKPVFVFDGGAPALKRQTITGRKNRREGRREDAARTAGKLLALQMQRRAEEEEQRRADAAHHEEQEELIPDNPVYVDELHMTEQQRQQSRKFRKKDQYHLPDLDVPLAEMGAPTDPRVMSIEELQQYAKQFEAGEDINVYDFSKIDFDSPFFTSLPATDRYNILNAARLRSRLRMGYSREQLDRMFPDRMAFSRFQVERVRERNELTQRLMRVGTAEDGVLGDGSGRVAGEKGREYVLVKNPDVEGGWALGVIGDQDQEGTDSSKPIDIEAKETQMLEERRLEEESSEDEQQQKQDHEEIMKRREMFYNSRRAPERSVAAEEEAEPPKEPENENDLFVSEHRHQNRIQTMDEDTSDESDDEETQLQLAIAMSMEGAVDNKRSEALDRLEQAQQRAPNSSKFANSRGRVATMANRQAQQALAKGRAGYDVSSDEDDMDLQTALAASNPTKPEPSATSSKPNVVELATHQDSDSNERKKFSGPLPFEKLDLGSSLLGKKKMEKIQQESAGGFEKDEDKQKTEKRSVPAPPWFSADVQQGIEAQREITINDNFQDEEAAKEDDFDFQPLPTLRQADTNEVIDVDALEESTAQKPAFIELESSDDEDDDSGETVLHMGKEDPEVRMGDLADAVRAEPPPTTHNEPPPATLVGHAKPREDERQQISGVGPDESIEQSRKLSPLAEPERPRRDPLPTPAERTLRPGTGASHKTSKAASEPDERSDEALEWSDSDQEQASAKHTGGERDDGASKGQSDSGAEEDGSTEDEVYIPSEEQLKIMAGEASPKAQSKSPESSESLEPDPSKIPMSGTADQTALPDDSKIEEEELFSDPEDEELMLDLANEAEEHARFAASFNNKSTRQNMEEYERELKALRNQQKKDRRDADEVTQVMIQECQQLLKLFGLPYVTAPMEAEAQCAELVTLGLVDGIVTDDSDTFLFGGTRVYKNMFNQAKFVECYLASDLERDFDLTRDKLISLAHLLGSDYTEGLPGVGPVNALEILLEFPNNLEEFRDWFTAVQQGASITDEERQSAFRRKFRKQAMKLFLPPSFPDRRVDLAYQHPEVDADPSPFQWGVPDLDALRAFLMSTIGWDAARTDEVLVPVIRDMNRRAAEGTQANMTAFLGSGSLGAGAFAPRVRAQGKSRRVEAALERLAEGARAKRAAGVIADTDPVQGEDAIVAQPGSALDEDAPRSSKRRAADRAWTRQDVVGRKNGDENGGSDADVDADAGTDALQERQQPPKRKKTGGASTGRAGKSAPRSKKRRVE